MKSKITYCFVFGVFDLAHAFEIHLFCMLSVHFSLLLHNGPLYPLYGYTKIMLTYSPNDEHARVSDL